MDEYQRAIKEQLDNDDNIDNIEDIHTVLNNLYDEPDISPAFLSSLFLPIFRHSIYNEELENSIDIYVTTLKDLYKCTLNKQLAFGKRSFAATISFIADLLKVIDDTSIDNEKYNIDFDEIYTDNFYNTLAIAAQTCSFMLTFNISRMEINLNMNILWNYLPSLINSYGEENIASDSIIKSATSIIQSLIQIDYIQPDLLQIENLIYNLLVVFHKNNCQQSNNIANTLTNILQACPNIKIRYPSALASIINSIAAFFEENTLDNVTARALLNVSCLILKNSTKAPWLDTIISLSQFDDLEILREKTSLLLDYTNNNAIDSEHDMEVDQDYLRAEWDMNEVLKCSFIHGKLMEKVGPIINKMVAENTTSIECKSLMAKLKEISINTDNTDIMTLCQDHMKEITEFVVRILLIDPNLAESVAMLIGYGLPQFLHKYVRYALPYAIFKTTDEELLLTIGIILETSKDELLENYAHHVVLSLLLEPESSIRNNYMRQLQQVSSRPHVFKDLATLKATKIITILCVNLGNPELQKQSALALMEMKKTIFKHTTTTEEFLSGYFLSFLTKVSRFISETRTRSVVIHDPYVLDALNKIMTELKSNLNEHTPHLIKVLQTINELDSFQPTALMLWDTLISTLDNETLKLNFYGIINGLYHLLSFSTHSTRVLIADLMRKLLDRQIELTRPRFSDLPLLPDYKELISLKHYLKSRTGQSLDAQHQMEQIIRNLNSTDDVQILFELRKLDTRLESYQGTTNNVAHLLSRLLYLARKYSSNKEISSLVGICLGKLGAINPSTLEIKTIDNDIFVSQNFKDNNENRAFVCHLITDHIYPAYCAINDENIYQFFHYAVQSLLKATGFSQNSITQSRTSNIYKTWMNLPPSIKEFLMPLLRSSYSFTKEDTSDYPFFSVATTFQEWIQKWYFRMTRETIGRSNSIFEACISIVAKNVTDVTTFLIPYLVLHLIISGKSDAAYHVIEEMMSVLNASASSKDDLLPGSMIQQCLEVVVSITEYARKWLNNFKIGEQNYLVQSEIDRVTIFLERIPDKTIAIAAFRSKAYPQALMHFETYCKGKNGEIGPEILNYLLQIYTRMEDRVDLIALLKENATVLKRNPGLVICEEAGDWEAANVFYRKNLDDDPTDISRYTEYIDCLKKWGNYETVLSVAEKAIINIPEWVPQINSLRIDSAWRLNDHQVLDKAVALPMKRTPEALIGCILSKMRNKQQLEAAALIEETRDKLVRQLAFHTAKSYRKSYPIIFNLQLLQELENSQTIWESENPLEAIQKIEGSWNSNYANIVSKYQFRHNLLELRKAAFFDIRPKSNVDAFESRLWLKLAKSARKAGNMSYAFGALQKSEELSKQLNIAEESKWYWARGIKKPAIDNLLSKPSDKITIADAILLSKLQMEDTAYLNVPETKEYFNAAKANYPANEKYYYSWVTFFTKHQGDMSSTYLSVKFSALALAIGSKYYYGTMSHLINGWFELAATNERMLSEGDRKNANELLNEANRIMERITGTVRPYQFCSFLTRLIWHLSCKNTRVANCLINIILSVLMAYPSATIWLLLSAEKSEEPFIKDRISIIMNRAQQSPQVALIIRDARRLVNELQILSNYGTPGKTAETLNMRNILELYKLQQLKDLKVQIPTESSLYPILPELNSKDSKNSQVFPSNLPTVKRIIPEFVVMKSLQRPKQITIEGSDGKTYKFLVKTNDDLRKDARTMEFNYAINSFLKKAPESRDNELYIRTYAVIPLGPAWGLIQWIDHIKPLKTIVNDAWVAEGLPNVSSITVSFNRLQDLLERDESGTIFKDKILSKCPPVFYKWFLKCFPEPNQWLASRTRYVKTLAVMSIVGYMVGLGDRHAENILFDENNGDCVHVDLNMLFERGMKLTIPELVPFRLTHNLVDAMGIQGYKGLFTSTCKITFNVLLKNSDALISVFETLGYVWAPNAKDLRSSGMKKSPSKELDKQKLVSRFEKRPESEASMKVEELIKQAAEPANLAKMYSGWAPFI